MARAALLIRWVSSCPSWVKGRKSDKSINLCPWALVGLRTKYASCARLVYIFLLLFRETRIQEDADFESVLGSVSISRGCYFSLVFRSPRLIELNRPAMLQLAI